MKSIVHTKYGSPDVLQLKEIEKPTPKEDEILIKVHASTVNRTDCGLLAAKPFIVRFFIGFFKPRMNTLGSEFAGIVESVGKDVNLFKEGDEVFGLSTNKFGTHAEYLCLPEDGSIALKPSNLSFEEAAAICEGPWLANTYLSRMNLHKETKILVNGASGSIGSSAIQIAKSYGAEITAVCNTKNIELVKSLGAKEVIDYTKEDFTRSGEKYDYVFDAVGKSSYFKCKKIMKKGATYFSTELGKGSQNIFLTLWTSIFGGKKVKFPLPVDKKKDIEFAKKLAEKGHLKAIIDKYYTLEQIAEAYNYAKSGQKTGSLVIRIA